MRDLKLLVKSGSIIIAITAISVVSRGLLVSDMVESWVWFHDVVVVTVMWRVLPIVLTLMLLGKQMQKWMPKYGSLLLIVVAAIVQVFFGTFFQGTAFNSDIDITKILFNIASTSLLVFLIWLFLPGSRSQDLLTRLPLTADYLIVSLILMTSIASLGHVFGGCIWYLPVLGKTDYIWARFGEDIIQQTWLLIAVFAGLSLWLLQFAVSYYKRYIKPKLTS